MKLPWQPLLEAELCEAELQQWEEALGKPKAWVTRRGLLDESVKRQIAGPDVAMPRIGKST